jgi:hypothetical protein
MPNLTASRSTIRNQASFLSIHRQAKNGLKSYVSSSFFNNSLSSIASLNVQSFGKEIKK